MLHKLQTFSCPCCGGFIGEAPPIDRLLECDLTRQQRIMVTMLSTNVGQWFSVITIERELWKGDGTKRAPNTSAQSISAQVTKMRPAIERSGWSIQSDRRGHYRLIPLEARS